MNRSTNRSVSGDARVDPTLSVSLPDLEPSLVRFGRLCCKNGKDVVSSTVF